MMTTNHRNNPAAQGEEEQTCESSFVADTMQKTKRLGTYMEEQAEQATKNVGAGMGSLGNIIHQHEPTEGVLHNAGEAMAAKLEAGGRYLELHGLSGVGEDLTNLIRKNPVPALLIGAGLGFLLAKMLKGS